jgi:hypothetical protein
MTDAHDHLVRTRAAQGLPAELEDDDVIARVAMLLNTTKREEAAPA